MTPFIDFKGDEFRSRIILSTHEPDRAKSGKENVEFLSSIHTYWCRLVWEVERLTTVTDVLIPKPIVDRFTVSRTCLTQTRFLSSKWSIRLLRVGSFL